MLIRGAELEGVPDIDVRVDADLITEIGPGLLRRPGEEVLAAAGGALLPGLHDHHVHLRAMLAGRSSVDVSEVQDLAELARRLDAAPGRGWIRAIGYSDPTGAQLDRDVLDTLVPDRPVRVQQRSGALWILNSRAIELTGAQDAALPGVERVGGRATGRLLRMDGWLRDALGAGSGVEGDSAAAADWAALSAQVAATGVTGFTDATPDRSAEDLQALADLHADGMIRQRLTLMAPPGVRAPTGVTLGPTKFVLDDYELPDVADFADTVAATHRAGRPVAVHCVTADQLVITLEALRRAGAHPGDRIEHASVVPPGFATAIREFGVTLVVQPGFIATRGDIYRREVDPAELPWMLPFGDLARAGVPLAGSTDAPYGDPDPWIGIRAAVDRRTASGRVFGAGQALTAQSALGLFLGDPLAPARRRRIAVGEPADLCLLHLPLVEALRMPGRELVAATVIGGTVVFAD